MPAKTTATAGEPLLWQQLSPGTASEPLLSSELRPHVLLVVDSFPRSLGGGERVVLRLGALLPKYGYRVSILTFSIDPESSFRPEQSPCPLYLLSIQKTYDLRALRGALALRRFLQAEKVQLVQTFFESSDLWAGVVIRAFSSARLIWSRRDMGILRGRKHALAYRLLHRLPHAVHAVSEQVRNHAIRVDGIAPDRTFTVYNGLDLSQFSPDQSSVHSTDEGARTDDLVVLTIGNIRHVKGHDVLVKAAALVREQFPGVRFLIAGEVLEQAYFEELCLLVQTLGLQAHVQFLGGVRDLTAQLRAADLFVLPSRSEGFSNSLLEAMACALPVVATDVGGNGEAIEPGVTGLLVPPEQPGALAGALLRLLHSSPERQSMGFAARRRVETDFSADAMLQHLTDSYRRILR